MLTEQMSPRFVDLDSWSTADMIAARKRSEKVMPSLHLAVRGLAYRLGNNG